MSVKEKVKSLTPPVMWRMASSLRSRVRKETKPWIKQMRAWQSPIRHSRLLARHRGVRPIRVIFLISNTASLKVGPVFSRMMDDPDFQPIAVVCPITNGVLRTAADHTADLVRRYLEAQGFPYIDMTGFDAKQSRAQIRKINPHLAFFTNPHGLVPKHLHDEILTSMLTCYVPYNHEMMAYGDNQEQYNQFSHNAFWRIFVPHEESRRYYQVTRIRGDAGVIVTGFPACEPLMAPAVARNPSPWKEQRCDKKRVIYAPHWLSRPDITMATINTFGQIMQGLAEKYQEDIQWALRPHPMLKPELTEAPEWGPQRTEKFFSFWGESDFCQIHEDDYLTLFQTSDAIIHDSGSFLAEYIYLRKPAMYLMTEETGGKYFNEFGRRAIEAYEIGRCSDDIERFLEKVICGKCEAVRTEKFFNEDIAPYFRIAPSTKICDEIKRAFS
jgi:hypothetical protein